MPTLPGRYCCVRLAPSILLLFAMLPGSIAAAAAPSVKLPWEVVYAGVPVASFTFEERREADLYDLAFTGQTVGFAAVMFPAKISATTTGTLAAGLPAPSLYIGDSAGRFTRHTRLAYHAGAAPDIQIEPLVDDAEGPKTPIPPDSLIDTVDPLSSLLSLSGAVAAAHGCAGAIRVFDGRRRYDLIIRPPGSKDVVVRSGPYQDLPALRCGMHLVPIGGYPVDPTKSLANNDSVFWLAEPPEIGRTVPVEIAFSGRWGVLRARLIKPPPESVAADPASP